MKLERSALHHIYTFNIESGLRIGKRKREERSRKGGRGGRKEEEGGREGRGEEVTSQNFVAFIDNVTVRGRKKGKIKCNKDLRHHRREETRNENSEKHTSDNLETKAMAAKPEVAWHDFGEE